MASRLWETVIYGIPMPLYKLPSPHRTRKQQFVKSSIIILPSAVKHSAASPGLRNYDFSLSTLVACSAVFLLFCALISAFQVTLFHIGLIVWFTVCLDSLLKGVRHHRASLIILGSILGSIGLGVLLTSDPVHIASGYGEAGVFLLSLALGWYATSFLTWWFTRSAQWWALLPGSMMALTGIALFF